MSRTKFNEIQGFMNSLNIACIGCCVYKNLPKDCGNCAHLHGEYNKYVPLIKNYSFLNAITNSKDDICKKSILNRMNNAIRTERS